MAPASARGDLAAIRTLAAGPLREAYTEHRKQVDAIVAAATEYNTEAERSATGLLQSRSRLMILTVAVAVLFAVALGVAIVRSLTRQLQEAARTLTDATGRLRNSAAAIKNEVGRTAQQSADAASTGDVVNGASRPSRRPPRSSPLRSPRSRAARPMPCTSPTRPPRRPRTRSPA